MRVVNFRSFVASVVLVASISPMASAAVVVPNAYASTPGNTSFSGPLSRFARTYQLLVDDSQLTAVAGHRITGVTWRLPTSATSNWPATNVNYASFDIFLSGSVDPSARSLTMASNVVGAQTQVRAGALTIPASSFSGSAASPEPFGFVINFDTPYAYAGGNLLLELRQSAHDGTDRAVDAVGTASSTGYGTAFSALWGSGSTATEGTQGNAIVTQFITVIPEPATLAVVLPLVAASRRRRHG